jgi:hypothetical protein
MPVAGCAGQFRKLSFARKGALALAGQIKPWFLFAYAIPAGVAIFK